MHAMGTDLQLNNYFLKSQKLPRPVSLFHSRNHPFFLFYPSFVGTHGVDTNLAKSANVYSLHVLAMHSLFAGTEQIQEVFKQLVMEQLT